MTGIKLSPGARLAMCSSRGSSKHCVFLLPDEQTAMDAWIGQVRTAGLAGPVMPRGKRQLIDTITDELGWTFEQDDMVEVLYMPYSDQTELIVWMRENPHTWRGLLTLEEGNWLNSAKKED